MLCGRDARTDTYTDAGGHQKQQALPSLPSSFDALTEDVIKGAWEKTGYYPWNPELQRDGYCGRSATKSMIQGNRQGDQQLCWEVLCV